MMLVPGFLLCLLITSKTPLLGQGVSQVFEDAIGDISNRSDFTPFINGAPENPVEHTSESLASIDLVRVEVNETADAEEFILTMLGPRIATDNWFVGISVKEENGSTVEGIEDLFDGTVTHFFNGFFNGDNLLGTQAGTVNDEANGFDLENNPEGLTIEPLEGSAQGKSGPQEESRLKITVSWSLLPEAFTQGATVALVSQLSDGSIFAVYDGIGEPVMGEETPSWKLGIPRLCDLDISAEVLDAEGPYTLNQNITILTTVKNNGPAVDKVVISELQGGLELVDFPEDCEVQELPLTGEALICFIGAIGEGMEATVPVVYKVTGNPPGLFTRDSGEGPQFDYTALVAKQSAWFGSDYTLGGILAQQIRLHKIDLISVNEQNLESRNIYVDGFLRASGVSLDRPVDLGEFTIEHIESSFEVTDDADATLYNLDVNWYPEGTLTLAQSYAVLRTNDQEGNSVATLIDGYQLEPSDQNESIFTGIITHTEVVHLDVRGQDTPDRNWLFGTGSASTWDDIQPGQVVVDFIDENGSIAETFSFNAEAGDAYTGIIDSEQSNKQQVFTLRVFSADGSSVETLIVTDNESEAGLPTAYALFDNYPNPFNPSTRIEYALPEPAVVTLSVYDVTGRRIRTLTEGLQPAGTHTATWDGADAFGQSAASGVYLYRMEAGDYVETRKMLMVK